MSGVRTNAPLFAGALPSPREADLATWLVLSHRQPDKLPLLSSSGCWISRAKLPELSTDGPGTLTKPKGVAVSGAAAATDLRKLPTSISPTAAAAVNQELGRRRDIRGITAPGPRRLVMTLKKMACWGDSWRRFLMLLVIRR
jgi:hypothetical protein